MSTETEAKSELDVREKLKELSEMCRQAVVLIEAQTVVIRKQTELIDKLTAELLVAKARVQL